ncbi:uncharacterized protein M6B38_417525 [Iris pallida]|uniref:Embryo defective 1923 n=1 Tax=Iris pallida TaxID=29817 RepID=A0AAX6FJJ2_IRIPA|nr:Uncharacterized protein M6B38_245935 [Iris pallida]KAJ6816175.1 uncharacterized protein M6B38_417525 [Iris pallida]
MAISLRLHSLPLLNPNSRPPRLDKPSSPSPSVLRFPLRSIAVPSVSNRRGLGLGFLAGAAKDGGGGPIDISDDASAEEARGESTMPERFRYLTKEAPDRAVWWPWLIPLVFLVYCWRTVLWELGNWKKALFAVLRFFGYLSKLVLAFIFHFIGDPITEIIRMIEFSLYSVRDAYSSVVAYAPVPELTRIILFTSIVLAIAEATVPESVNSQPYLLSFAGIIGFAVVKGIIPVPVFWLLLPVTFCYSRYVKKRDGVSAALPSASVLAAVGEPWVGGVAIASYLALAIAQHSKSQTSAKEEHSVTTRRLPIPLLLAAMSIGVHVAAKWIRYRHLTWMIA